MQLFNSDNTQRGADECELEYRSIKIKHNSTSQFIHTSVFRHLFAASLLLVSSQMHFDHGMLFLPNRPPKSYTLDL